MEILRTVSQMQARAEQLRQSGKRIALVPTMGALHEGHLSLVTLAKAHADIVILSIFVNPTQFGPNEDYRRYPRDPVTDERLARDGGAGILFYPEADEMYPADFLTYVVTNDVAQTLEGKVRPTHFQGVTTIVAKLFNAVKPHVAVFGKKDAQQLFIVRAMVRDLNFDVEVLAGPIVRESDGLAKSSRNAYLNAQERENARSLSKALAKASELLGKGERDLQVIRDGMFRILEAASPSHIDYVAFVDPATFREVERPAGSAVLILLAVRFGATRLIDNMLVSLEPRK